MGGFKDVSLNQAIALNILKYIIVKLINCCNMMVQDCIRENKKISNNEVNIRDYLFFNYLDNDEIANQVGLNEFRFFSEAPENYINNKPVGRTDLKVISNDMFRHRSRYFIIECKRLDCMFGFVVKDIDIDKNTMKINHLQKNDYPDVMVKGDIKRIFLEEEHNNTYVSSYTFDDATNITLFHAFCDLSPVVAQKMKILPI